MKYASCKVTLDHQTHQIKVMEAGCYRELMNGVHEYFWEQYDLDIMRLPIKPFDIRYGTCND